MEESKKVSRITNGDGTELEDSGAEEWGAINPEITDEIRSATTVDSMASTDEWNDVESVNADAQNPSNTDRKSENIMSDEQATVTKQASLFDPNKYKQFLNDLHQSAVENISDAFPKEQLWVNIEAINTANSNKDNKPKSKTDCVAISTSKTKPSPKKLILFWTTLYRRVPDYADKSNKQKKQFDFNSCEYSNCEITVDRQSLKSANALIFSTYDTRNVDDDMPTYRAADQRWILFGRESPINTYVTPKFNGLFNTTMTYRLDSDVRYRYGRYQKRSSTQGGEPGITEEELDSYANKPKLVTWIVSNCGVHSRRDNYVTALRQYIDVDIYGSCSRNKCGDHFNAWGENMCRDMIKTQYKFYLALENTLCWDYITEKPWKALQTNAVPIVMGHVDYARHLPPKSYIDIKEFLSPKKLAEYLLFLDKNHEEYKKYFDWRRQYEVVKTNPFLCDLCRYLNKHENEVQIYTDLNAWWNQCLVPRDYFRGVFDDIIKDIDKGTLKRILSFQ